MLTYRRAGVVREAVGGLSGWSVPGQTSRLCREEATWAKVGTAPALDSRCFYVAPSSATYQLATSAGFFHIGEWELCWSRSL